MFLLVSLNYFTRNGFVVCLAFTPDSLQWPVCLCTEWASYLPASSTLQCSLMTALLVYQLSFGFQLSELGHGLCHSPCPLPTPSGLHALSFSYFICCLLPSLCSPTLDCIFPFWPRAVCVYMFFGFFLKCVFHESSLDGVLIGYLLKKWAVVRHSINIHWGNENIKSCLLASVSTRGITVFWDM